MPTQEQNISPCQPSNEFWTYSINDVDGDGEALSDAPPADLLQTKADAYKAMCAIFDGPIPESGELDSDKQYVPPANWSSDGAGYVWDVYADGTFIVRVFRSERAAT